MPLDPTPLRFEGGRFDEAGYPLDALGELVRYERLVVEVARGLWMDKHPTRKRAPRHFDNALRLRLSAVEDGSVIPVLKRARLRKCRPSSIRRIGSGSLKASFAMRLPQSSTRNPFHRASRAQAFRVLFSSEAVCWTKRDASFDVTRRRTGSVMTRAPEGTL